MPIISTAGEVAAYCWVSFSCGVVGSFSIIKAGTQGKDELLVLSASIRRQICCCVGLRGDTKEKYEESRRWMGLEFVHRGDGKNNSALIMMLCC